MDYVFLMSERNAISTSRTSRIGRRKPAARQVELGLRYWGGKRKGAGRPNRSGLRAHVRRPRLDGRAPLHVTLKVNSHIPNLKRQGFFALFREAVLAARERGLRINQYSIQSNHLHLIIETDSNQALERGMKCLSIRLALGVKKRLVLHSARRAQLDMRSRPHSPVVQRKAALFRDRYHLHVLRTPTEVKRALGYVTMNEHKHSGVISPIEIYSSVNLFWRMISALEDKKRFEPLTGSPIDEICSPPRTWLLKSGWLRAPGGADFHDSA